MKKLVHICFFLFSISVFSQGETNIWYFGLGAGLDFNTAPPTALTDGVLNTEEGCASFSDANGDLLFYTDGSTVYDKNHIIMQYTNGSLANNLNGDASSTQSAMIIPMPENPYMYYLFTVGFTAGSFFTVYTIDMCHLMEG